MLHEGDNIDNNTLSDEVVEIELTFPEKLTALGFTLVGGSIIADSKGRTYGCLSDDIVTMSDPVGHSTSKMALDCIENVSTRSDRPDILTFWKDNVGYDFRNSSMTLPASLMVRTMMDCGAFMSETISIPLEAMTVKNTMSSLRSVLDAVFPDLKDQLWFDELNEMEMYDPMIIGEDGESRMITDYFVTKFRILLSEALERAGHDKIRYNENDVRSMLSMIAHEHRVNAFRDWLETLVWDGVPRLRTWFIDTVGATAPMLEDQTQEQRYLEEVSEAWFMGAVIRAYHPVVHEVVPVLMGSQGVGKSSFIRYTAAKEGWYTSTGARMSNPQKFLESTRGRIIVELAEAAQLMSDESEDLKQFISTDVDLYRKPYRRDPEPCPRQFILIATTNRREILTDSTGNRRFFPMMCQTSRIIRHVYEPGRNDLTPELEYEVEQVWAEAYQHYLLGTPARVPQDILDLACKAQDAVRVVNYNAEYIDEWLDDPANGYDLVGARITRREVFRNVFGIEDGAVIPQDAGKAYRIWRGSTQDWEEIATSVNGRGVRLLRRIVSADARKPF